MSLFPADIVPIDYSRTTKAVLALVWTPATLLEYKHQEPALFVDRPTTLMWFDATPDPAIVVRSKL